MQDSIEDYLKLTKNVQSEPIKSSKEAQITAQIKKECDKKAMKIVEFSIEGRLRPEIFIKCLPFINQSHYQDIVEERAITKICGYSICGQKIPEMPKQQFYISTISNKIYDISDRKNYCSNFCYKASLHIKKQIDNSPLWLRKHEELPQYKLLHSSEEGLPGEIIDQGIAKLTPEPSFTSVSLFTESSLTDMIEKEVKPKSKTPYRKSSKILKSTMQTISENVEQVEEEYFEEHVPTKSNHKKRIHKPPDNKQINKPIVKILPAIDENEEKIETIKSDQETAEKPPTTKIKKAKNKSNNQKLDIECFIKNVLNEWLTIETYMFIYGEEKVKQILDEKKLEGYFETLHVNELDLNQQLKYMEICKRLKLQEMAEDKFDNAVTNNQKLLPLPDYKKLKDENKEITIKVKSYYSGDMFEQADSNFPQKKVVEKVEEEGDSSFVPLVDVKSQTALRRKIFLNSINKSMHHLLHNLHIINYSEILSDLQSLIKTFKLKADNIIFKPIIWNYISLILLYILSLKNENIENVLKETGSQEHIDLLLNVLPNRTNFVTDILTNFQNMDLFVEKYITKKECDE